MKKFLWMAVVTLLVSGCGELSYKRGASTQDLEAAKKTCQSAGSEKAAEQCLKDQGWTVKKLDDVDLFATAGVSPDNRNPSVFITPEFVPVTPARPAAVVSAATTATPAAADKPASTSKTPAASAVGIGTSTAAPLATPSTPPTTPSAPASPPVNPLDLYVISSWWKIGADREALAADTNECVAQLGEAHKPNSKTQQVTRGFVVCMHDKGWKALRAVAG